jgi:hypothetical protein
MQDKTCNGKACMIFFYDVVAYNGKMYGLCYDVKTRDEYICMICVMMLIHAMERHE